MNSVIRPVPDDALETAFVLLRQLRPERTIAEMQEFYRFAHLENHYRLVGIWEKAALKGVLGFRVLHDFLHGRHWYVDDLVIGEDSRSKGLGKQLLDWLESEAKNARVRCLRLSTGINHERGKLFYEREGWSCQAVTYKKFL